MNPRRFTLKNTRRRHSSTDGASMDQKKVPTIAWPTLDKEEKIKKKSSSSFTCLTVTNKSIYILVLLILNITLLRQIHECYIYYEKEPTYVESKITPQQKALFPAMTICPVSQGYKEEILKVVLFFMQISYILYIYQL